MALLIKKIVIAGGSGFIGKYLAKEFGNLGYEVIIISRRKENIQWNDTAGIINALENSEILIDT
jgi:nucleoside-diphosphate-sugar epimerase